MGERTEALRAERARHLAESGAIEQVPEPSVEQPEAAVAKPTPVVSHQVAQAGAEQPATAPAGAARYETTPVGAAQQRSTPYVRSAHPAPAAIPLQPAADEEEPFAPPVPAARAAVQGLRPQPGAQREYQRQWGASQELPQTASPAQAQAEQASRPAGLQQPSPAARPSGPPQGQPLRATPENPFAQHGLHGQQGQQPGEAVQPAAARPVIAKGESGATGNGGAGRLPSKRLNKGNQPRHARPHDTPDSTRGTGAVPPERTSTTASARRNTGAMPILPSRPAPVEASAAAEASEAAQAPATVHEQSDAAAQTEGVVQTEPQVPADAERDTGAPEQAPTATAPPAGESADAPEQGATAQPDGKATASTKAKSGSKAKPKSKGKPDSKAKPVKSTTPATAPAEPESAHHAGAAATSAESAAPATSANPAVEDAPATNQPVVICDDVHIEFKTLATGKRFKRSNSSGLLQRGRQFKTVHALKGISFVAHANESIGIIGSNGSGKSTLMRALTGLIPPTSGAIYAKSRPNLLGVGAALIAELSGSQNIILGGLAMGMAREEIEAKFDDVVTFSGLEKFIDMPMRTYSSGMTARLKFAIATAKDYEILIVDEALSVGDRAFKKRSEARIREIREGAGTVFLVSHSMRSIRETCNRTIWIEKGDLRADGPTDDVLQEYESNK